MAVMVEQHFGLHDLRGRVAIQPAGGPGLSPYRQGEKGGAESNTLTVNEIPSHSHAINAVAEDGNESVPTNNVPAGT
jgi:microcystin-dependent protein